MYLDLQGWEYDLRVAVWHHNIAGPPSADDYLNVAQAHSLIDFGFRLGLHGHQHRSELVLHELGIPEYGSLAVLSAGSVAAGHAELPRGVNRQYNLIELSEDLMGARLNVREIELGAFGPRRLKAFGGHSYIDITWQPYTSSAGTPIDGQRLNQSMTINEAEAAYMAGNETRCSFYSFLISQHSMNTVENSWLKQLRALSIGSFLWTTSHRHCELERSLLSSRQLSGLETLTLLGQPFVTRATL